MVAKINGKDHFWCWHHKRWNQIHNTKSCPGPKRNTCNVDKTKTPQANVAAKEKPTPTANKTTSTAPSTCSTLEQTHSGVPSVQFCLPTTQDAVSMMSDPTLQLAHLADPSNNYANMVSTMPRFDTYGRRLW